MKSQVEYSKNSYKTQRDEYVDEEFQNRRTQIGDQCNFLNIFFPNSAYKISLRNRGDFHTISDYPGHGAVRFWPLSNILIILLEI